MFPRPTMQARLQASSTFNHSTRIIDGKVEVETLFPDMDWILVKKRVWAQEPFEFSTIFRSEVERSTKMMTSKYAAAPGSSEEKQTWILEDIKAHESELEKKAYRYRQALQKEDNRITALKYLHAAQTATHPFDIYRNITRVADIYEKPAEGDPGYLPKEIEDECARELQEKTRTMMQFRFKNPNKPFDHLDPGRVPIHTMTFKNLPDVVPGAVYKTEEFAPPAADYKSNPELVDLRDHAQAWMELTPTMTIDAPRLTPNTTRPRAKKPAKAPAQMSLEAFISRAMGMEAMAEEEEVVSHDGLTASPPLKVERVSSPQPGSSKVVQPTMKQSTSSEASLTKSKVDTSTSTKSAKAEVPADNVEVSGTSSAKAEVPADNVKPSPIQAPTPRLANQDEFLAKFFASKKNGSKENVRATSPSAKTEKDVSSKLAVSSGKLGPESVRNVSGEGAIIEVEKVSLAPLTPPKSESSRGPLGEGPVIKLEQGSPELKISQKSPSLPPSPQVSMTKESPDSKAQTAAKATSTESLTEKPSGRFITEDELRAAVQKISDATFPPVIKDGKGPNSTSRVVSETEFRAAMQQLTQVIFPSLNKGLSPRLPSASPESKEPTVKQSAPAKPVEIKKSNGYLANPNDFLAAMTKKSTPVCIKREQRTPSPTPVSSHAKEYSIEFIELKPAETKIVGIKPVEMKPADAKASELKVKPVEVKATDVKPAEVKPVEVKPLEVKPVEVKPVQSLAEVKPAEVEPAEVKKSSFPLADPNDFLAAMRKKSTPGPQTSKPVRQPLTPITSHSSQKVVPAKNTSKEASAPLTPVSLLKEKESKPSTSTTNFLAWMAQAKPMKRYDVSPQVSTASSSHTVQPVQNSKQQEHVGESQVDSMGREQATVKPNKPQTKGLEVSPSDMGNPYGFDKELDHVVVLHGQALDAGEKDPKQPKKVGAWTEKSDEFARNAPNMNDTKFLKGMTIFLMNFVDDCEQPTTQPDYEHSSDALKQKNQTSEFSIMQRARARKDAYLAYLSRTKRA